MITRSWLLTTIVLCAIAGGSFALSTAICSRQACGGAQASQTPALITSYLKLTPEQERKVEPINESFAMEQHMACMNMQEARTHLLSVLQQPHPRQQDINAALADLEQSQAKLQRGAAQYLLDLKSVLREDQQRKLFDLVGQRFCEQGKCGGGICPGIGRPGCGGIPGCMR